MSENRTIRIVPVDHENGVPRDGKLATAVQEFAKKEFGSELVWGYYLRVWAVELVRQDDPAYFEIVGVTALRNQADCPVFHLQPPSLDKEGIKIIEQARDAAVYRMHSYLADIGLSGSTVLIYVNPDKERFWRKFLARIKARPSPRYELTI